MKQPTYGMKVIITRSDQPGMELAVDLPVIGARGKLDKVRAENPALNSMIEAFDSMVSPAAEPE